MNAHDQNGNAHDQNMNAHDQNGHAHDQIMNAHDQNWHAHDQIIEAHDGRCADNHAVQYLKTPNLTLKHENSIKKHL